MTECVYLLQHSYSSWGDEWTTSLLVYRSLEKLQERLARQSASAWVESELNGLRVWEAQKTIEFSDNSKQLWRIIEVPITD